MRKYELTYLVSDLVPESDLNKTTGRVSGLISDLGGKVDKEDVWGRRKLAYPIKKQDFATYITLNFSLPAEKAQEFEKDLHHVANILRQLMIVRDYGSEEISLTAEEIAHTEDIENVIGGEKSFEAVEGETEDSKGLMSKRPEVVEEKAENAAEAPSEETTESVETPAEDKEETVPEKKAPAKTAEKKATKVKEEKVEKPSISTEPSPDKKKAPAKKKEKTADEAERLSKLNEELDDILKDEL